ncbi:hypothetical protein [Streptomyces sp. HF10]|uniref:hypothetical protein n=1 Tax=Streptomyces sp. HF10 TaxID=2692233 RepID=UPI0013186380|nr:hypothetical protein [Streptomyces sp. HF10]QHC33916.1 hypothetical protein GR129_35040 [Streptomyces sp. HF10]
MTAIQHLNSSDLRGRVLRALRLTVRVLRLVGDHVGSVADWIDPDSRDGDDLWDVATALRVNADDIASGADYDDIRLALQVSQVLPALHGLTVQLRNGYALDGEMEEAAALSDTAALVRAAAESMGHLDLGE